MYFEALKLYLKLVFNFKIIVILLLKNLKIPNAEFFSHFEGKSVLFNIQNILTFEYQKQK